MKKQIHFLSFRALPVWLCLCLMLVADITMAQNCGCTITIEPPASRQTSITVNGTTRGIKPGNTICIKAGFYKQIRFENIVGSSSNPVTIKNCGGKVVIGDNTDYGTWYAIDVIGSKFIRLTGSGDPSHRYGIKIAKSGDSGLKVGGLSTDTEIDHMEIANTGFAGILAKTDFGGSPPANTPEMNNVNIHDMYIHDIWGEGMYIGETKTPGQNFRHLKVWNNVITRTGLEPIQIANTVENVAVYNNVFYKGGTRNINAQNKGLQIGDNSVGRFYNNVIMDVPSNLVIIMGSGHIDVYNNYIDGAGEDCFFVDNRSVTIANAPIKLRDNYIRNVNSGGAFFKIYNELNPISITGNRLQGSNTLVTYGSGAGAKVSVSNNTITTVSAIKFVDVSKDDFRLVSGSPYAGIGLLTTVTPPPSSLKFSPSDDAYLQGSTRYNSKILRVEAGNRVTYMKFTVTGLSGAASSAKLRLKVSDDNGHGTIRIAKGSHNNWTETNLSASNKPSSAGALSHLTGNFNTGTIYSFDVKNAITGNGTYTFILTHDSGGNDVSFDSKEGAFIPELLVEGPVSASGTTTAFLTTEENLQLDGFSAFPNPFEGSFRITIDHNVHEDVSVMVYGPLGQLVWERQGVSSRNILIDLSDNAYKPGIYITKVIGQSYSGATRMIKK